MILQQLKATSWGKLFVLRMSSENTHEWHTMELETASLLAYEISTKIQSMLSD